jgi:hypothetical protein
MEMLLYLPIEEQAEFADDKTRYFVDDVNFVKHMLYKSQNTNWDDPRNDEERAWTSSQLGNIALLATMGPEEYREAWMVEHKRFVDLKLIEFRKKGCVPTETPRSPPR